jgi:hypothetical protein
MNAQDYLGNYINNYARLQEEANKLGLQGEERSAFMSSAPTGTSDIQSFLDYAKDLNSIENMREKLQATSEFDKERMAEAAKYKALFDLPKTIMQGITGPSQMAAEASRGIASSMMQAGQQIPQLVGYTPRNTYSYTPTRYFG